MHIPVDHTSLKLFEVLASPIRLKVLERLRIGNANIKQLASYAGVSSAIMTTHVNKLEEVGLIHTYRLGREGKVCELFFGDYQLVLPSNKSPLKHRHTVQLPLGEYTKVEATPPCGMVNYEEPISVHDDPRVFFHPKRCAAACLWLTSGFVEYTFANYVENPENIVHIDISAELGSEYPLVRDDWKSAIVVYLNDVMVCEWVSPGDFGDRRGAFTPGWYLGGQYGILKHFTITNDGVYLDQTRVNSRSIKDYHPGKLFWTLRFEVKKYDDRYGGMTIYGKNFGDYAQGIEVKVYSQSQ